VISGDHQLRALLEPLGRVLLVRAPWVDPDAVSDLLHLPGVRDLDLSVDPVGADTHAEPDAVLLVVRDRAGLRAAAGAAQALPASTRLGCLLLEGDRPPLTAGHPSWPVLTSLTASAAPACFVLAEFATPLAAGRFLGDLARRVMPSHQMSAGWPVLGLQRDAPHLWAAGDPVSVVGSTPELADSAGDYPPDVLVLGGAAGATGPLRTGEHHVLGTLVADLRVGEDLTWAAYDALDADVRDRELAAGGPLVLGGFDGQVLNPIGFRRRPHEPVRDLSPVPSSPLCRVETEEGPVDLDSRRGVGEHDVTRLRAIDGVHLRWLGGSGPQGYCRIVVGLAMAGVPLTCDPVPTWARALIHPDVLDALSSPRTDGGDRLLREVRSIRLRRAAHAQHGVRAWKDGIAVRSGLAPAARPRVSVLLATRRPEQLDFALRQIGRQRDVDLEVVLAAHGHEPDPRVLAELASSTGLRVTCLTAPARQPFGQVLNDAAGRAQGDVLLKMDDDDWYGPDFVSDLLLARSYSGADVVGTPPEFIYVEPLDLTVHRRDFTERYHSVVAGGTIMVSRQTHQAVGGFRPTMQRAVDLGFLKAVSASGGSVYRTHGHSYLLRRSPSGHTWDPGLGYFVSRARTLQQWRGLRPSPLFEPDQTDTPRTAAAANA
jgi:hypothetical protein